MADGYNGWRNRATGAVSLRLNNDKRLFEMVQGWYQESADQDHSYIHAVNVVAKRIEDFVEAEYWEACDAVSSFVEETLLINPVDADIDYFGIAEAFIDYPDYVDMFPVSKSRRSKTTAAKRTPARKPQTKRSGASKTKGAKR